MDSKLTILLLTMSLWLPARGEQLQSATPSAQVRSPHGTLKRPCQDCHTFTSWKPIRGIPEFDHNQTKFPLQGLHTKVSCRQCHTSLIFSNAGARCADCHADIHRRQMGAECEHCHTVNGWRVSLQSIERHMNRFPLTGSHAAVECYACHKSGAAGRFQGLSPDCASCHISDFNKANNPNHKSAGFPSDCSICHSPISWSPASFDHSRTGFPLTGVHATLTCVACHANGNFTATGATCVSCHLKDYNNTTNPNHRTAGIPTDCFVCHSTRAWRPATFNHNLTPFPLTGTHQTVPCAGCHVGGRYAGTPTDCYSCHKSNYNGVTNPNHVAAQFPTNCALCHNTATWLGATFSHSWFPIYSGTHAGKWMTCNDCHVNPSNFGVFSCINCHAHDRSTVDPHHSGVRGYSYTPTSCYSCHASGQGGG